MSTAILLIAHGSRRDSANRDLVRMAELLGTRLPEHAIHIAYLEIAEPTIPQGAMNCIKSGATEVRLLPFFLSPGSHVVDDLEEFRLTFEKQYPGVRFELCPPLGLHPLLVEILVERSTQRFSDPAEN